MLGRIFIGGFGCPLYVLVYKATHLTSRSGTARRQRQNRQDAPTTRKD